MRAFLLLSLIALVELSGCAPYWEQTSLKDKVKELEDRVKDLESAKTKDDLRRDELEACVNKADESYWSYVKLNGGKPRNNGSSYWAPTSVWEDARRHKLDKIEECKLLYGTPR